VLLGGAFAKPLPHKTWGPHPKREILLRRSCEPTQDLDLEVHRPDPEFI